MEQESRKILEEKVVELTCSLENLSPDSEEYKATVSAITVLATKVNESLKIDSDNDRETCHLERENRTKRELGEAELAFKQRELDAKIADEKAKRRKDLISDGIKGGVEIAGIVIPLKWYAKFLEQGYKFEKHNIVSSVTFKNFLRFLKPRR